jgi:DNA polymerase I-like protein with 3'-5' exonuclease and polymerase domains
MTSPRVALIETRSSRTNFYDYFDQEIDFDSYALCSDPSIKKVLKKHVDIEIDVDAYDLIILVGSDALKNFTSMTSVTTYSGKKVDGKYLPIINPAMLAFKPEATSTWESSKAKIIQYVNGEIEEVIIDDSIAFGINDSSKAMAFLTKALEYDKPYVSLDSETTALYPRDGWMQGFSMSYDGKVGAYISTDCIDEEIELLMQQIFTEKIVIFHNAKFDLAFFEFHFGFRFPNFEDTMLLHYLIDENPGNHGLKYLAMHFTPYGDYEKPMREWMADFRKANRIKVSDFRWEWIPFEIMYPYAAMDALCTFLLYEKFVKIKGNKKLLWVYDNILIPGCRFLTDIQDNGVPFDRQRLETSQELMQHDIDEAIAKLNTHPEIAEFETAQGKDFNPNSVVQLRTLMFDFLGLQPTGIKTGTGQHSTNAEVLEKLSGQSEVPGLILDIRQKSKIKNTYLDKIIPQLDRDSRLRTNFNIHTTTSGRLSSSGKLNMQQLPRDNPIIKGCIKARPGYKIVHLDLTTAEVYVAAVLSKDEALMDVFRTGGDFHSSIAKKVFDLPCAVEDVKRLYPMQRQAAKAVTFGIMYGAGPNKISEQVTKDSGEHFSVSEAKRVIDDYFTAFSNLRKWIDENQKFIKANGFIYSYFGRKRRLPNVNSSDRGIQGHSIRSGLNFLVQSAASDINLLGAIDANARIKTEGMEAQIFALVHDSILAEVPEDEIDKYSDILLAAVQMDRGIMIPGCPVGCDMDVGDDYSFGKYEKKYDVPTLKEELMENADNVQEL